MTLLQRLAFERIETLNQESLKLLPDGFRNGQVSVEMLIEEVRKVSNNLYEQQRLIDALNREEHS
jgi:hypothetical protein